MNTQAILSEFNAAREAILPALVDATEDEVLNDLLLGRAQLWRGSASAMVTMLVRGARPFVEIWLGGGDLAELKAMAPMVASWAKQQGAHEARINGRKGWEKTLKAMGFERDGQDLRMPL